MIWERRGPQGRWKLTPELRGKILLIVLRERIWKLERFSSDCWKPGRRR